MEGKYYIKHLKVDRYYMTVKSMYFCVQGLRLYFTHKKPLE